MLASHDDKGRRGTYREKISLERVKSNGPELQREIRLHWLAWNEPAEPKQVDRPHMPVTQATPNVSKTEPLAVVHVSLGWVVAEDPIDHDLLFMLAEPPILAPELARCLRWRWW